MDEFSGLGLTLWPEWSWAIGAIPGRLAKRVENRGQPPWTRLIGPDAPWIALHAGAHVGGRKGWPAHREGLHGVAHMAQLAGWRSYVNDDGPDFWQLALVSDVHRVQVSDPRTGALTLRGARLTDGRLAVPPCPEDNEQPLVTSAILGLFRVTRVLSPGQIDDADGIRGWKVPDAYGWVIDYRRLPAPIPCGGAQGFWSARDRLLARDPSTVEQHLASLRALTSDATP